MTIRLATAVVATLLCNIVQAIELNVTSVRATVSKPDTSHTLIYQDPLNVNPKTAFNLTPLNNERIGFFVDVNGIEIGYAVDVFESEVETKTQNLLFSYRKFKNARITLNLQVLEGLNTQTENLDGIGQQTQFLNDTKSTKIELFGIHNLYTFGGKSSVFEHFFLNKPLLSNQFDWSLGIVGGWSIKHLTLENPDSIVSDANFLNQAVPRVEKLESTSFSANVGPFLSVNLPNNINFFAEYKYGKGNINSSNNTFGLKQSGDEKAQAIGLGLSWTASDQKTLILLRGWEQKGRHISTSFGDLSVVRFF